MNKKNLLKKFKIYLIYFPNKSNLKKTKFFENKKKLLKKLLITYTSLIKLQK